MRVMARATCFEYLILKLSTITGVVQNSSSSIATHIVFLLAIIQADTANMTTPGLPLCHALFYVTLIVCLALPTGCIGKGSFWAVEERFRLAPECNLEEVGTMHSEARLLLKEVVEPQKKGHLTNLLSISSFIGRGAGGRQRLLSHASWVYGLDSVQSYTEAGHGGLGGLRPDDKTRMKDVQTLLGHLYAYLLGKAQSYSDRMLTSAHAYLGCGKRGAKPSTIVDCCFTDIVCLAKERETPMGGYRLTTTASDFDKRLIPGTTTEQACTATETAAPLL